MPRRPPIRALSEIYQVNDLPHRIVRTTRGAYYHCKCSPTHACLFVVVTEDCATLRACECVRPMSRALERIFLVYDLSTKSKQAKLKGREREREREMEEYRGRSVAEETEMSEG